MAVLNYTRVCKICSKDFVRTEKGQYTKFCSDECKKENKSITNKSVPVEKKKEYQDRAYKKIKDDPNSSWAVRKQRAIDNKRHGPFMCKGCNKEFYKHSTQYTDYCTKECSYKYIHQWKVTHYRGVKKDEKAIKVICYLKQCVVCNNRFHTNLNRGNTCSKECESKRISEKDSIERKEQHKLKPSINCNACNVEFTRLYLNTSSTCSDGCSHELMRRHKRIDKAKRRAIERGLDSDNIDPIKIFERDKWICHICNKKTDMTKRGTYEDKAPELDHIISLADGGSHTLGNVACSCRKCNGLKGSKSFGQLSFGFV